MLFESHITVQFNPIRLKCELVFRRVNNLPFKYRNVSAFSMCIKNIYTNFILEIRKNKMIDKAELKRKYKQTLTPMGIYIIKNLVNGKIFIGKSKNIPGRINRHKFDLERNAENIQDLQKDYNQFGLENFSFEILDQLEPKEDPTYNYTEDLTVLEELWLEKLQPFGDKGYNIKK